VYKLRERDSKGYNYFYIARFFGVGLDPKPLLLFKTSPFFILDVDLQQYKKSLMVT